MRIRAVATVVVFGALLRAQGCWPLIPPPPPPPDADQAQLGLWPSDKWAGEHQVAVLRALFADDLEAQRQSPDSRLLIRCFPLGQPYQLEVVIPQKGTWTIRGWFVGNLEGTIADLKAQHPGIDERGVVEAMAVHPVELQVDPKLRRWAWLNRLKTGVVPSLVSKPTGTDGELVCWKECTPDAGIVQAPLLSLGDIPQMADSILRLEKELRAAQKKGIRGHRS